MFEVCRNVFNLNCPTTLLCPFLNTGILLVYCTFDDEIKGLFVGEIVVLINGAFMALHKN